MLASDPASILNHNSPIGGIPSDSNNLGNALAAMDLVPTIPRSYGLHREPERYVFDAIENLKDSRTWRSASMRSAMGIAASHPSCARRARAKGSIANFAASMYPGMRPTYFDPAALPDRSAALRAADNLSRCLRLGGGRFRFRPLRSFLLRRFPRGGRLPDFDLLASVVVADLVTRPTRDFRATVAIGLEPVIASQGADAPWLGLDCIKGVGTGGFYIQSQAGVLIEKIKRTL
jgi:hypothetical protein